MICLFPFTHVSSPRVKLLAETLGPVSICLPVDRMASSQVKAWGRHGILDIRIPDGLDGSALMAAMRGFKQWAGIHGTKLSDISDFYKLSQGRPPLVDEDGPGRILTQIKRRESGTTAQSPDRRFASALFLALAHDHDVDLDEAERQLESVEAMEADLYARMAGKRQDSATKPFVHPDATVAAAPQVKGVRMSSQRLQAWACLAQSSLCPTPSVFVTTSSTILDLVLEQYPSPIQPIYWELSDTDGALAVKQQRLEALGAFSLSTDPQALLTDDRLIGEPGSVRLVLHILPGVAPPDLLSGLSKMSAKCQGSRENSGLNCIVGRIESQSAKKSANKA
jgi:hypothetical protein